jgi:type VI protein secretion system component VasK
MNFLFRLMAISVLFWVSVYLLNIVLHDPKQSLYINILFYGLIFMLRFLYFLWKLSGANTELFWEYNEAKKSKLKNVSLQKKK